jgi:hypothetical protein
MRTAFGDSKVVVVGAGLRISVVTIPPVPKVGSRAPFAVNRATSHSVPPDGDPVAPS